MKNILCFGLLVVALLALKPSEAGVNDWHINNIGEVREMSFVKNKVHFISNLNSIGIIDKYTGKIDSRISAAESEKIVNVESLSMSIATRYNQLITYNMGLSAIGKQVNNQFMNLPKNKKIISTAEAGSKYFLTSESLFVGSVETRQAEEGQQFLRVQGGKTQEERDIAYLIYTNSQKKLCIDSYTNSKLNTLCPEQISNDVTNVETGKGFLLIQTSTGSYVLHQNLSISYSTQQKLIQIVDQVATFTSHSYHCKDLIKVSKRPLKSNRGEFAIYLTQNDQHPNILKDDLVLFELPAKQTKVLRAWFNYKSELDYEIIVQYTDLQLVAYSISSNNLNTLWKKEESLAYIEDVIFMKYFELDTLDNEYHRHLISHSYRSMNLATKLALLPRDITLRLTEEVNDFMRNIQELASYVIEHLTSFNTNSIRKFEMSKQQEIKYGLRKYVIALTQKNTILAFDTKTSQILWKINIEQNDHKIIGLIQLKKDYETEIAVIVSYSSESSSIYIKQISQTGTIKQLGIIPASISPTFYQLNEHSLLFKIGDKVQKYSLLKEDDTPQKQYYFYTTSTQQITGWKVIQGNVVKIWSFETSDKQKILKVSSAFRGDQRSHIPLYDREKVFFKNVDFTNIAFVTSLNHTNLALYIVNGRTGKVQFNAYKSNVNMGLPFSLVYDEHNVLVSYFNARNKMFEIWTVEQYQQRIQSSAINMISDYLKENQYKPLENREHTIFEDEVFGLPITIKEMFVSESKMSLTRRNLFIITRENKVYTINRDFVSSRRPKKEVKGFFSSEKLPEYAYILPYNPTSYLSYHLPLANLNSMKFSPTDMQSSIFALSYGTDIFLIRTAPDKTFDMITDDFNHVILLIILVVGTVVILVFRGTLLKAKLRKPHLE